MSTDDVHRLRAAIRQGETARARALVEQLDPAERRRVLRLAEQVITNELDQARTPLAWGGAAIDSAAGRSELDAIRALGECLG